MVGRFPLGAGIAPDTQRQIAMLTVDPATLKRAASVWKRGCEKLQVRVVAPFRLAGESSSFECIAFLPDFGSPNGMVVVQWTWEKM